MNAEVSEDIYESLAERVAAKSKLGWWNRKRREVGHQLTSCGWLVSNQSRQCATVCVHVGVHVQFSELLNSHCDLSLHLFPFSESESAFI